MVKKQTLNWTNLSQFGDKFNILIGYSIVCCAAFSLGTFHTSSCAKKFKYKKFFQSEIILKETKRNFLECFLLLLWVKKKLAITFQCFLHELLSDYFLAGNIQGSLVNFCQKESPREIQMCKLVQISRQKS